MDEPGLDKRHRDKNGEISRKHGNTEVKTLRKIYGPGFCARLSGKCKTQQRSSDFASEISEPVA